MTLEASISYLSRAIFLRRQCNNYNYQLSYRLYKYIDYFRIALVESFIKKDIKTIDILDLHFNITSIEDNCITINKNMLQHRMTSQNIRYLYYSCRDNSISSIFNFIRRDNINYIFFNDLLNFQFYSGQSTKVKLFDTVIEFKKFKCKSPNNIIIDI